MTKDGTDTQAERMPHGKPASEGLANAPQDTATGRVQSQDGPLERPGTEAEDEAANGADVKRRTDF
ncbi:MULTISPECIES: hypothetical protein [Methylobacterium]|uniref:hypothetical protein n=1 Tax=Methylobacterium TaxID=407 RepID=UPI001052EA91|nr:MULTISPECIES: hypothetical protein [Methylobacterium]MDR7039673.1 hypothetical protein [Methylobacterium sp. BE186]